VPIAVVRSTLFAIRQNGVGFAAFFELLFRVGVIGVAVWMELQCQFAIGALYFLVAGSAYYPQYLVIVAFSVTRQNGGPFPF
jgi:hypothetical protein